MARVELPITVINGSTGLPVAGAAINATLRSTGSPATWYSSETGGTGSTTAIITDSAGRANAWLERGAYNLAISGTGITSYTEPWDAVPASDNALDAAQLQTNSIPLSKLAAAVQEMLNPPGVVKAYAGSTAPTGYLICDGTAVSRTTYSGLFAAIGTTYGVGDGSTTFNLPNLKGRMPVGYDAGDTNFNAVGKTGGAQTHTLTAAQSGSPAHTHADTFAVAAATPWSSTLYAPLTNSSWQGMAGQIAIPGQPFAMYNGSSVTYSNGSHAHTLTGAVSNSAAVAASAAHNNLQPFMAMHYIIKT